MNIGVDLDGVVYQTEKVWRDYAEKYNKLIGGKLIDDSEARVDARYDWTKEQYDNFVQNLSIEILAKAPIYPKTKEVISKLRTNNKVIFITRRGFGDFGGKEEIDNTLKRLKVDGVEYDKIVFKQDSKVKACKENNIDIMIDDYYKVIDELMDNGVKCLCFRDKRNKTGKHKVPEVYSWEEVLEFFENTHNEILNLLWLRYYGANCYKLQYI